MTNERIDELDKQIYALANEIAVMRAEIQEKNEVLTQLFIERRALLVKPPKK